MGGRRKCEISVEKEEGWSSSMETRSRGKKEGYSQTILKYRVSEEIGYDCELYNILRQSHGMNAF